MKIGGQCPLTIRAFGAVDIIHPLGLPAFAALFWKKATKQGILAGMISGFAVCIGWKLLGQPLGLGAAVPGTLACAAALVGVSLMTCRKNPSRFLDVE